MFSRADSRVCAKRIQKMREDFSYPSVAQNKTFAFVYCVRRLIYRNPDRAFRRWYSISGMAIGFLFYC